MENAYRNILSLPIPLQIIVVGVLSFILVLTVIEILIQAARNVIAWKENRRALAAQVARVKEPALDRPIITGNGFAEWYLSRPSVRKKMEARK